MKRIAVVVIVLLALFAAAGWAFALVSQVQLRLAQGNAAEHQRGRTKAEAALVDIQAQLASCSDDTAKAQAEGEEYLKRVLDLEIDAALWERLYTTLQSAYACAGDPPEIDYTSQATVSASLKGYIEHTRTRVENADWYVIWDGVTTAAIHRLLGSNNVMYVYIAWLDDPEWQFENKVFSVDHPCWLDPGEADQPS